MTIFTSGHFSLLFCGCYNVLLLNLFIYLNYGDKTPISGEIISSKSDIYVPAPPVLYSVLVVSEGNRTRLDTNYKTWGRYVQYTNPESVYMPIAKKNFPPYNIINYTVKGKPGNKYHHLIYGFEAALEYFIKNTTLPWFLRTTDDVFIYFPNFANILHLIEERFDPYKDKVVKGHLIKNSYINGGPGWLLSRKAAEVIYNALPIETNPNSADDLIIRDYLNLLNISRKSWHSKGFMASRFSNVARDRFANRNFTDLPPCREHMCRMIDIAVWHAGSKILYPLLFGNEYMKIMPPDMYGYANFWGTLEICKSDQKTAGFNTPSYDDDWE